MNAWDNSAYGFRLYPRDDYSAPAASGIQSEAAGLAGTGAAYTTREIAEAAPRGAMGGVEAMLSRTEFALFTFMAKKLGQWVGARELVEAALGTHHRPESSLVRVHVHNIRRKLGPLGQMIESRRGRGYRIRESFFAPHLDLVEGKPASVAGDDTRPWNAESSPRFQPPTEIETDTPWE